ncbi:hypothetical protein mgb1_013 [Bacillus phage MG-B1]|uniref:Uncharacterized protein n=1 Tax=Bacillus phage MG-B1 TaxID=1309583 RepID=M4W8C1_9CAUD|nr:hypothetical protein mgb1_013 [Bacillus phage MG-B1]AGI10602.1 hypothetical protein mgb1_013 [Bacillus phage MG-B1]
MKKRTEDLIKRAMKETGYTREEVIKHILTFHVPLKKMKNPLRKFKRNDVR